MAAERTLLITPGGLGNAILLSPLVSRLAQSGPVDILAWAPVVREYFQLSPEIGEIFFWPEFGWGGLLRRRGTWLRAVIGAAVNPLRGGLLALASGAPIRVGEDGFFYTHRVKADHARHEVERNLALGAAAGYGGRDHEASCLGRDIQGGASVAAGTGSSREATGTRPSVGVGRDHEPSCLRRDTGPSVGVASFDGVPALPARFVALHPGSGARLRGKRWPLDHFAAVVGALRAEGIVCVVLGDAAERDLGRALAAAGAVDLTGQLSLAQTAGVLRRAALYLGNDTGLMHLAAAVGTRVLALFGPTREVKNRPWGNGHRVLTADLPCRPCYRNRPIECSDDYACLRRITPDRVIAAARELLR